MYVQIEKPKENISRAAASSVAQKTRRLRKELDFVNKNSIQSQQELNPLQLYSFSDSVIQFNVITKGDRVIVSFSESMDASLYYSGKVISFVKKMEDHVVYWVEINGRIYSVLRQDLALDQSAQNQISRNLSEDE